MHEWFLEALEAHGGPVLRVSGAHEDRMSAATAAIDPLLVFPVLGEP